MMHNYLPKIIHHNEVSQANVAHVSYGYLKPSAI